MHLWWHQMNSYIFTVKKVFSQGLCYKEEYFTVLIRKTNKQTYNACMEVNSSCPIHNLLYCTSWHHSVSDVPNYFITSLFPFVSLVSPAELIGIWGGGGTWHMGHGQGKPDQCWKPLPSWSGGAGALFIREWGARMEVSPGKVVVRVEDVDEDSALPSNGCTWCAGLPECPLTVPQWNVEWCPP